MFGLLMELHGNLYMHRYINRMEEICPTGDLLIGLLCIAYFLVPPLSIFVHFLTDSYTSYQKTFKTLQFLKNKDKNEKVKSKEIVKR